MYGKIYASNYIYYYYPSMPTHPHPIMPQHTHHKIPPHLYSSIPPHQVCLCPYFNYTPMHAPYVTPQYTHMPSLGYLHTYDRNT